MLKTFPLRHFRLILNILPRKQGHPASEIPEVMHLTGLTTYFRFYFPLVTSEHQNVLEHCSVNLATMTPERFHPTPLDQPNTRRCGSAILPQIRQGCSNHRTALALQVRLLKEQNTTAVKVLNCNINPVMLLRHFPA